MTPDPSTTDEAKLSAAEAHGDVDEVEYLRLLAKRLRKDAPLYEDIHDAAAQLDAFADSIESRSSRRALPSGVERRIGVLWFAASAVWPRVYERAGSFSA